MIRFSVRVRNIASCIPGFGKRWSRSITQLDTKNPNIDLQRILNCQLLPYAIWETFFQRLPLLEVCGGINNYNVLPSFIV